MRTETRAEDLRTAVRTARARGATVGLVPTMGALHAGHLSLVDHARSDCDLVVVSVFVNPLQFGPGEDYETYPRDLDGDARRLADHGAHVLFAPDAATFTPAAAATTVHVAGLTEHLEGASRPGHFDGVATIVTKLLAVAEPDRAYFGEKDYQQLCVIRRLVADLALPGEVVACPIVRDADGLALSSRNAYLSAAERDRALALPRALGDVAAAWDGDADAARTRLAGALEAAQGVTCDYAEIADPDTLAPLHGRVAGPARALAAVWAGPRESPTRLIDNVALPAVAAAG